jgi:Flp pilus assembly protein TadB
MPNASFYYTERQQVLEYEKKRLIKTSQLYFILRLLLFSSLVIILIWFIRADGGNISMAMLTVTVFAMFLTIIRLNINLTKKIQHVTNRIAINTNELNSTQHQFSNYDPGDRFMILNPSLSGDFDLFGEGSLFQYLNRSVSSNGAKRMAQKLCYWDKDSTSIELKQQATGELSTKLKFLEDFQALGMDITNSGDEIKNLEEWFNSAYAIKAGAKVWLIAYPILFSVIIILVIASILQASIIIFPVIFAFLVVSRFKRRVDEAHDKLGRSAKLFEMYSSLMELMENEKFESTYLKNLQNQFVSKTGKASLSINRLFVLLNRFDYRYNILVNILFNTTALFDLQILYQLEKWKRLHRHRAAEWFKTLAEMEALVGFARFAFNNNDSLTYPKVQNQPFGIIAKHLGHPLIPASSRISNDMEFVGQPTVVVVTGANMAGKSTFLRTIAVNLILAHNGAPVCASEFSFSPCDIVSSINIHDSLAQNESYFYAELLRIRQIIDHVSQYPNTLVVLDEILRGTNPKDKQMGSMGLIEKLIKLNAFTLIATHDLAIGQMEETYPQIVQNRCFEVELEDDQLIFDYKLKDGISKKLNASFLLKKMGIID